MSESEIDFDDVPPLDDADIVDMPDPEAMARDAATIARVARMTDPEYDRVRKAEAVKMGVRVETLDTQRKAAQAASRPANAEAPMFSDDDLALRFSAKYGSTLRYTAKFGMWHQWNGTHWKADQTLDVFTKARGICREASRMADYDAALKISRASTVAAVERLARDDRRHAATVDQWDAEPWLLTTPGGTVDLRTGILRASAPNDHSTKTTAVAPGGQCPAWLKFLHRVTAGDTDLQDFMMRFAGYCLTGQTSEHALAFCYGTGGNGKGVFLNTLTAIMGDYATVAGMDTFTATTADRHPADLAMLRGARLVTSQETAEGRKWAEARIKAMTGGDPISARFMRQDFFTYQPAFKLIIAGNHKPGLRNVDEAIRRRFHLIPFTVRIPPEERDTDLPEKLKAEWPGILAWMIEGCLHWQKIGLAPPAAVQDATDEYLSDEDAIWQWIKERCKLGGTLESSSTTLFSDWRAWADKAGEFPSSQKRFSQGLQSRGFAQTHGRAGNAFRGIGLNAPPPHPRYGDV